MTTLRTEALSYGTGEGRHLVDAVDLIAADGETVGLVGPNGSGKTTLLRCVYGTLRPTHGRVLLDGDDLATLPVKARARRIATVPQESHAGFELTVGQVVAMGRAPHKRFWEADSAADTALVTDALERVGIAALEPRTFASSPAANANAPWSPAPWSSSPRSSSWTSRPTTWTSATSWRSSPWSGASAPPTCWPCTTSTSPRTTATASTSSRTAGSSPPAPRKRCSRRSCWARCTASPPRSAPIRRPAPPPSSTSRKGPAAPLCPHDGRQPSTMWDHTRVSRPGIDTMPAWFPMT